MRDNKWLENKMWEMLHTNFADVPVTNELIIKFGRKAKQRLGSIRRKEVQNNCVGFASRLAKHFDLQNDRLNPNNPSIITITGYFRDPSIPECVVLATIAHELVHYAHGFSSPLTQKYQHPHKGGVVKKELIVRELGEIQKMADNWLKANWVDFVKSYPR